MGGRIKLSKTETFLLALTALFLVTAVSVRLLTPRAAASQYTVEALTPSEETEENRVNINTASASELDALPGIGPVLAQRIIDRRTEQGPFTSVEELLEDMDAIMDASQPYTLEEWEKRPWLRRMAASILKLGAIWL